jgi:hypothetical protein
VLAATLLSDDPPLVAVLFDSLDVEVLPPFDDSPPEPFASLFGELDDADEELPFDRLSVR